MSYKQARACAHIHMDVSATVAVFPNAYSRKRAPLLTANIRSMLKSRSLRFSSVRRDGDVIIVDAHDPVFASSAIGLLFGTGRIAIARRAGTQMHELVEAISVTASSLLLKGERFIVKVGGNTDGYLPRDAEIAATSKIISDSASGAKPGTKGAHDRVIHAHVAKSNSYVSIFSDAGRGGVPFGTHAERVSCPVHDELSALAMLEALRQGYDILPTVVYSTDAARMRLAKAVCKIVSSIPRVKTSAEFVRISPARGAQLMTGALRAAITTAKSHDLGRICIPTSPLIHDTELTDSLAELVQSASMARIEPLAGAEPGLGPHAAYIGADVDWERPERFAARRTHTGRKASEVCRTGLELQVGSNMLYDALDSLDDGC